MSAPNPPPSTLTCREAADAAAMRCILATERNFREKDLCPKWTPYLDGQGPGVFRCRLAWGHEGPCETVPGWPARDGREVHRF